MPGGEVGVGEAAGAGVGGDAEVDEADVVLSSTMMFSGLRSRWTTPLAWMYSSASRTPTAMPMAR
jgi:hypothetical protein